MNQPEEAEVLDNKMRRFWKCPEICKFFLRPVADDKKYQTVIYCLI